MAGGERRRLVEEEKLGPAPPSHDVAPDVIELELAGYPGLGCPTPPERGLCGRVVDDAAVGGEKSLGRIRYDVAEGCDAVLKRSACLGRWSPDAC